MTTKTEAINKNEKDPIQFKEYSYIISNSKKNTDNVPNKPINFKILITMKNDNYSANLNIDEKHREEIYKTLNSKLDVK